MSTKSNNFLFVWGPIKAVQKPTKAAPAGANCAVATGSAEEEAHKQWSRELRGLYRRRNLTTQNSKWRVTMRIDQLKQRGPILPND